MKRKECGGVCSLTFTVCCRKENVFQCLDSLFNILNLSYIFTNEEEASLKTFTALSFIVHRVSS